MEKELFIETIEVIEKQQKIDEANTKHINKVFGGFIESYNNSLINNQIMKLLQAEYPTYPGGICDIEYFCFELDFGRKYKDGMVTQDDEIVDLSTSGKLWDYLTSTPKSKKMILLKIKYRTKYYYTKAMHFVGLCPKCFSWVNYTTTGRAICPNGCKY